jgi:hypothetical protein
MITYSFLEKSNHENYFMGVFSHLEEIKHQKTPFKKQIAVKKSKYREVVTK